MNGKIFSLKPVVIQTIHISLFLYHKLWLQIETDFQSLRILLFSK